MSQTEQQTAPVRTTPQGALSSGVDFDDARQRMVNDQVRPVEVNDPRILAAMRTLPRELAVPPEERGFAYADRSLPLGSSGRFMLQPMIVARLVQMAGIREGERVLVVGAGTGYLASLLASLGADVTALESDSALVTEGRAYTDHTTPGVSWHQGPLTGGAPEHAPFDLILVEGAIRDIPPFCAAQLAKGGRVVGLLSRQGKSCSAFVAEPEPAGQKGAGWAIQRRFDAQAPLLEALLPAPAFSF